MSNDGDNAILESEKSFEDLLGRASPRRAPTADDTVAAKDAVHAEWLVVIHKRKRRRRFASFAAAASVLLAIAIIINVINAPLVKQPQVASINQSLGSIYVLGEQSRLQATGNLSSISAGQTIVTGKESGLGLAWGSGGSLRIDADSRVTFVSATVIKLESGRVYFDSMNLEAQLEVHTKHGVVTHLGTQYMSSVSAQSLSVSVREGSVSVDGLYYDGIAEERQRLTLTGSARPEVLNISPFGDEWAWVEATAPPTSFDGKTVFEFLQWVARETGFEIEFESASVETVARTSFLSGDVDSEPRVALRQRLLTTDLDYDLEFEKGVIHIVEREERHD